MRFCSCVSSVSQITCYYNSYYNCSNCHHACNLLFLRVQDRLCLSPCRTSSGVPIFEKPPPKYSAYRIMEMLLDPNVDQSRIARKRPLEVQFSSTFLVDVRNLAHQDDIKKDMYGRWIHSGSHTDVFLCSFGKKGKVHIEKAAQGARGKNVFYLQRLHSVHPSNSSFQRVLALLFGMFPS